jgi:hypothetical protein
MKVKELQVINILDYLCFSNTKIIFWKNGMQRLKCSRFVVWCEKAVRTGMKLM